MKIKLISQASVIISCSDCKIWTDPWLKSKAFNNSWSLYPKPDFNEEWLREIDFMWVSHEHPDHFNIPTLKALPTWFKENVTVLFQKKHTDKLPKAFKMLGFKKIKLLDHAKLTDLTPETQIFVYQIGILDSSLGVKNNGQSIFNLNDCEPNSSDYKKITKNFSSEIDVVLNQFSLAGNNGSSDDDEKLKKKAKGILDNMITDHRGLNAKLTIPIASFIYFSSETNKYINAYHNTIEDVKNRFEEEKLDVKVLYINDEYDLSTPTYDDSEAVRKFAIDQSKFDELDYDSYDEVPFEKIKEAFLKRKDQLEKSYPSLLLKKLSEMSAFINDGNYGIRFSIADGIIEKNSKVDSTNADLLISSQPFFQAFGTTWGVQTLGVAAQYFIEKNQSTWKWYRIVTNLNNSEIYLKPKYVFTKKFFYYTIERLKNNGLSQLYYRFRKAKKA